MASRKTTAGGRAYAAIYRAVRSIPRGRVATYGTVALLAGMPGAARTVGWALRALDETRDGRVPWHRVLGAGGVISLGEGPSGQLQRARLRAEGVRFRNGRAVMEKHGLGLAPARTRARPVIDRGCRQAAAPSPRSTPAWGARAAGRRGRTGRS